MSSSQNSEQKRPIIIGNVAGAMEDCPYAMHRIVTEGYLDAITGDWLSELNIAWNAIRKQDDPTKGYEVGFLEQLDECIDIIADKKIKVVSNAGALNTPECARKVKEICQKHGHEHLKVAYIEGDDISTYVTDEKRLRDIGGIVHLDHQEQDLASWDQKPYCAVAYFGGWGIVEALRNGADIVICGRVTDASPVIALAAWWHGWGVEAWNQLAGALVAGHLVECGPYVTGANFSGLRPYIDGLVDLGFPITEIAHDGSAVITKHPSAAGYVEEFNVRAQFLYEIQGTKYLNPDVMADIEHVHIENTGEKDRVRVFGAVGGPPPPTTKAITVALGGYQAEATFYINGLDIDLKQKFMTQQLKHAFRGSNFSELSIERYGSAASNPRNQASGTVSVRVLVKGKKEEDIQRRFSASMCTLFECNSMQASYHMSLDFRTMTPKRFMQLFPGLISYVNLPHRVVLPDRTIEVKHHGVTQAAPGKRPSNDTADPVPLGSFGETKQAPLGAVAHGRSGDKGDNCNIGLFARNAEEYKWLQSFLTISRMKNLLGDDWRDSSTIERCEFPHIMAVHFRLLDFLGGGGASSTRIDMLGKGVAEYIRSKVVDIPLKFLKNPISWIE